MEGSRIYATLSQCCLTPMRSKCLALAVLLAVINSACGTLGESRSPAPTAATPTPVLTGAISSAIDSVLTKLALVVSMRDSSVGTSFFNDLGASLRDADTAMAISSNVRAKEARTIVQQMLDAYRRKDIDAMLALKAGLLRYK